MLRYRWTGARRGAREGGWGDEGPGGEVVQPHGVILEGRMAVGHGGMAGVAGFGEKAEVCEAQAAHQRRAGLALPGGGALLRFRMDEHAEEQHRLDADQGQAER